MGTDAQAPPRGGVYRPRNLGALYQWVERLGEELRASGDIRRAVETQALERHRLR